MTTTTTRKPTTEDIENGYSNLNVEDIREKFTEILCLDAYAGEREKFFGFIQGTLIGRYSWVGLGETEREKKDDEIYERIMKEMDGCIQFIKTKPPKLISEEEWVSLNEREVA